MKINSDLSGTSNVIALIRESNPRFTFDELAIKITNVVGRNPDVVPYNTEAKVEGRDPAQFYNPVFVYYNRRSMKEGKPIPTTLYSVNMQTTFADVLSWIATDLKLVASEVELVDFRTAIGSTVSTVTLRPKSHSPLYFPEVLDVTLSWTGSDALALVPYLPGIDELHKLMNITLPAPGYF